MGLVAFSSFQSGYRGVGNLEVDHLQTLGVLRAMFADHIKSRIFGYSNTLPPRRNKWGEPIFLDGGLGPDFISPFYSHRQRPDKASQEAWRVRAKLHTPNRNLMGVELTPEEHDRFVREGGVVVSARSEVIQRCLALDLNPAGRVSGPRPSTSYE